MASVKDTATFFAEGTHTQFEHVLTLYPEALRIKAENHKSKKPEELIKLDNWYQNELPKKIKARGKDGHLTHEELCQTMKWKQIRGKFYPQLSYLVKVNTPRAVMAETKKAFKKLPNLEQAITALSNLKGVGTTMASALLAAASPEHAPFMADECLMAIPEIEGIDYTTKEYLNFVQHIQNTVTRLNKQNTNGTTWSPHRVELALWTHYIASEMKPELLEGIPDANGSAAAAPATENGNSHVTSNGEPPSDDSNQDLATATPTVVATVQANGKSTEKDDEASQPAAALDENSTTTSFTEDSLDKPSTPSSNNVSTTAATPPAAVVTATATETPVVQVNNAVAATVNEDTNDSAPTNDDDNSSTARPTDESEAGTEEDSSQDSVQEPPTKKSKK